MKTIKFALLVFGLILQFLIFFPISAGSRTINPITIGVLENRNYAYAGMMQRSFALALDSINARGGIGGQPLQLVYADDGGQKDQGVKAVKYLVEKEKVVMLTGGYSSSNTLVMAQTADKLGVPFLVCTAADDRITQHRRKNIFRLNPPASEYTRGLEQLLEHELKPKTMAIVYENSPFGTSSAIRMMWFCREKEIEIVDIIPYHKERATADYFDRIVAPLARHQPEAIFMVSYFKDGVLLVKQIRAAGITSRLLGGAGGFTHPKFIEAAGDAAKRMLTATLWSADVGHQLAGFYVDRYRAQYEQTPDYHGAEAYSALLVVADALRRAGSTVPEDIRNALLKTRLDTPFGRVVFESYAAFKHQNSQSTLVLQNINNRYVCVWPPDLSTLKITENNSPP
jgi:branched-chain amino acid transport system substrate-binding protein